MSKREPVTNEDIEAQASRIYIDDSQWDAFVEGAKWARDFVLGIHYPNLEANSYHQTCPAHRETDNGWLGCSAPNIQGQAHRHVWNISFNLMYQAGRILGGGEPEL